MATSVQSLKSKTETSITMNWSSSDTIDVIWYSSNNGSTWTNLNVADGKSGTYTISGLKANTTYKVKTRVRVKSTQKTVDSSALSVTTYDYPHCIETPDFTLGEKVTLKFYNPLSRKFNFYIIGNEQQIAYTDICSGDRYIGLDPPSLCVPQLYDTIPSSRIGEYKIKVDYDGHINTFEGGGTYVVNENDCRPIFNDFSYEDWFLDPAAITGDTQVMVQNLSLVAVTISKEQQMATRFGATPEVHVITVNGESRTYAGEWDSSLLSVFEVTTDKLTITVAAYDSRGLSTRVTKDITVYPYVNPVVNATLTRKNNFENETTLKVSGKYSPLTIGGVNKNSISSVQYRYRETGGVDWSDWATLSTTVTPSKGTFTCANTVINLDNTKAYDFEVQANDIISNDFDNVGVTTKEASVGIGNPVFIVSSNKKLCYMNGKEMAVREDVPTLHSYTNIPDGTDLNTLTTIGVYKSTSKAHSNTMINVPSGISGGFRMVVSNWTGNADYNTYVRQDLYYFNRHYVRNIQNADGTWTAWQSTAFLETAHPIGSVYISSENINPANTLGIGTWTLIDKSFASAYCYTGSPDEVFFTAAENCTDNGTHFTRGDHAIHIRQSISTDFAMTDASADGSTTYDVLGYFNWSNIGVTSIPISVLEHLAYSDGANGGIVYSVYWDTGEVRQVDTFDLDTVPSDKNFHLDFTVVVDKSRMIDSYCDKFYWKRTE